jgi:hypothetical protein
VVLALAAWLAPVAAQVPARDVAEPPAADELRAAGIVDGWTDFAAFAQLANQSRRMPGVGVAAWVVAADEARRSALAPPAATPASAGALIGGYEQLTRITQRRAAAEPQLVEALRGRYLTLAEEIVALWTLDDFSADTFAQLEASYRGVGARIADVFYRQYRYLLFDGPDLAALRREVGKLDGLPCGFSPPAFRSFEVLVEAWFREFGRTRTEGEISGSGAFAFQKRLREELAGWNAALVLVAIEALAERGPEGMFRLMTDPADDRVPSQLRYRTRLNWDDLTAAVDVLLVPTLAACLRAEGEESVARAQGLIEELLLGEEFQRPRLTLRRSSVPLVEALYDVGVRAGVGEGEASRRRFAATVRMLELLDTEPATKARERLTAEPEPPPEEVPPEMRPNW